MTHIAIPSEYVKLFDRLQTQILPWRKLTIAIDGVDGAGKSSLARFLAWQLGMPVIETDFFLAKEHSKPLHDAFLLEKLIQARHGNNRPVIVEGIFVLRQLSAIGVNPEILVKVHLKGHRGSHTWQNDFKRYRTEFPRAKQPDYIVRRTNS